MPFSDWDFLKQSMSSWWIWKGKSHAKFDGSPNALQSSGDFMVEDVYAGEQQFKAKHSPKFAVGATAKTLKRSVSDFQQHLLAKVSR